MKNLILVLSVIAVLIGLGNLDVSSYSNYEQWKMTYKVEINNQLENMFRYGVYLKNKAKISKLNQNEGTTFAENEFMLLTEQEFMEKHFFKPQQNLKIQVDDDRISVQANEVNWVQKGAVTPVGNQGTINPSWPFAVLQNIETLYFEKNKKLMSLPVGYLIYCCPASDFGPENLHKTYKCLDKKGMSTSYPDPSPSPDCQVKEGDFKIKGYKTGTTCNDLVSMIQTSPVTAYADASQWQFYSSGVFNNCKTSVNHIVSVVGYLSDYWVIKNSWGTAWGEKGFIRLSPNNTCGICSQTFAAHE